MDWSEWLELDPQQFERRLRRRLNRQIAYNEFVALYNSFMRLATREPIRIADTSRRIAALLRRRGRMREALLFWEQEARSSVFAMDLESSFSALRKMIDADGGEATKANVLDIARGIWSSPDWFGSSLDQRPRVLAAVADILAHYGEKKELAELHLEAAALYSRHGATQASYRSIADAEDIAHEVQSPELLARICGVATSTACEERDFSWAVTTGEKGVSVWREIGRSPPASLLNNLGVARMNLDQNEAAAVDLQAALKAAADDDPLRATIAMNLAACLRKSGDLEGAWKVALEARGNLVREGDPERVLELALITARIAGERRQVDDIAVNLQDASRRLDDMLGNVLRLHHRRGIRERYVPRIEGLLRELPPEGPTEQALPAIAAVRSNALGDWLSILDWATAAERNPAVSTSEKTDIARSIDALQTFGAPHLFGFREKYDDAWSPMNGGSVWDDLSGLAARLEARGLDLPITMAGLDPVMARCRHRLAEGHCLMALTYAGQGAFLWSLIANRYLRVQLPHELLLEWKGAMLAHAASEIDRNAFDAEIRKVLDGVWEAAASIFEQIATTGVRSIRFIQDFGDSLPITTLATRHPKLAAGMAAGTFHVRLVPALYIGAEATLPTSPILISRKWADANADI